MPSSKNVEGSRFVRGQMAPSTSGTPDSRRNQALLDNIAFIFLVVVATIITGAFVAWATNWIVAEVVLTVREQVPQPDEFVVQVMMPTPTPRIATPTLGTDSCKVGMVCVFPTQPPQDCADQKIGGQACYFTGSYGDAENQEEGNPSIVSPGMG